MPNFSRFNFPAPAIPEPQRYSEAARDAWQALRSPSVYCQWTDAVTGAELRGRASNTPADIAHDRRRISAIKARTVRALDMIAGQRDENGDSLGSTSLSFERSRQLRNIGTLALAQARYEATVSDLGGNHLDPVAIVRSTQSRAEDVQLVGPGKAIGDVYRNDPSDPEFDDLVAWAKTSGLPHRVGRGVLFVWHPDTLNALLQANAGILQRNNVPVAIVPFVNHVQRYTPSDADLADLIGVAYADPRYRPEFAQDPNRPTGNVVLPAGMQLASRSRYNMKLPAGVPDPSAG